MSFLTRERFHPGWASALLTSIASGVSSSEGIVEMSSMPISPWCMPDSTVRVTSPAAPPYCPWPQHPDDNRSASAHSQLTANAPSTAE